MSKGFKQNRLNYVFCKPLWFAVIIFICGWCLQPLSAQARQELITYARDGRPLFQFIIYDEGEEFYIDYEDETVNSPWTIGMRELQAIQNASDYWALLLGNTVNNTQPLTIFLGTLDYENAFATSPRVADGSCAGLTMLQAGITANYMPSEPAAYIALGFWQEEEPQGYYGPLEVLPEIDGPTWHTGVVVAHELGHALGILSSRIIGDTFSFNDVLGVWDEHLVDSFGNASTAGMEIIQGDVAEADKFVIRFDDGYAFFQGSQVLAVLDGAILDPDGYVAGLPVNGFEERATIYPEFNHIELKNSFMSHQRYRNYGVFMEAELAAMNDIGYEIDLKNHYGYSLYASGRNVVNTSGFWARNADGTAYLQGEYNLTPLTVGLHIYGANNKVVQAADILSAGLGSVGARVDGFDAVTYTFGNNHLTIASNVKVHTFGERGTGVMVAYGKNHVVVNRGEVAALGDEGIGARFDFGDNVLGDGIQALGSYIWVEDGENLDPDYFEDEGLDGPLVSRFDLTGVLAGNEAAIYIADNAYVANINVMRGARIYGDIISEWDPYEEFVQHDDPGSLMTNLVFGLKADADGEATAEIDDDFYMDYQGDIIGSASLDITLMGGRLQYEGSADVNSFTVNGNAALVLAVGAHDAGADIRAGSVDFQAGSMVEVVSGLFAYDYNSIDLGPRTVLTVDAGAYANDGTLMQTDSFFAVGPYDYFFNAYWQDSQTRLAADVMGRAFNNTRGGTLAVTAPLAMFVYNSANDALLERLRQLPAANDGQTGALWVKSGYNYAKRGGSHKYNIKSPGASVGGDVWVTDRLFLGAALSFEWPKLKSGDAGVDARNVTGALYGGALLPWDVELGAFAAYGRSHYDQTRKVASERFKTTYNSDNISLGVELGRSFGLGGGFTLRPFASYEFLHLETDGYAERGGVYALSFDAHTANLHRLNAGLDLAYVFGNGAYLSGRLYYAGLYGQREAKTTAFFSSDPAFNTFTAAGLALDRNSLGAGVEFACPVTEYLEFNGGYDFLGGSKNRAHQVSLGITFKF